MDREVVKRPFARPNQYMLAAAAPHGESSARKAFKGIVAGMCSWVFGRVHCCIRMSTTHMYVRKYFVLAYPVYQVYHLLLNQFLCHCF